MMSNLESLSTNYGEEYLSGAEDVPEGWHAVETNSTNQYNSIGGWNWGQNNPTSTQEDSLEQKSDFYPAQSYVQSPSGEESVFLPQAHAVPVHVFPGTSETSGYSQTLTEGNTTTNKSGDKKKKKKKMGRPTNIDKYPHIADELEALYKDRNNELVDIRKTIKNKYGIESKRFIDRLVNGLVFEERLKKDDLTGRHSRGNGKKRKHTASGGN